ncbi:DNA-binding MarR family transcriptional regulator [Saccharopolyspora erythraea NRRL 2338]|uniref:MarR-family transcriptional regulator n=2 Tax=Saccharopolyspora erythraea TaxID=1836 RepID=A4F6V0_SACEN|nr:MarR family transcriptional regulator [Saccharopolyspora erythraea]EQD81855.1 MarR family transcriptional regulator [Saccharopolyspora erythraea D]PFG93576.1 DNA-binding MarR family transcriptional regulator [Saccharopolyspora erythraea NRRL 2338]QRK90425.1 MarR family transcriptional regulator [Saccharopolyspora erythraea]CAL99774.1 MarR-family transcriptional regulator [Saccharopolyspora erythraea NRRL 2338]
MERTPDLIDTARSQWREVHPDLDTTSIDVVGRVLRASAVLRQRLDAAFAEEGLNRAEFDLLCALRRSDAPVTPGRLNSLTVSSGAATTKRIQQLAERGLLERAVDARDRRSARIALTEQGREVIDRAFRRNLEAERHLLSGLDPGRRQELVTGLADLLGALEGPGPLG